MSHLVTNIGSSTANMSGWLLYIGRASIAGAIAGLRLIATTGCSRAANMCGAVWDQLAGALIADSLSTRATGCRVQEGALIIGGAGSSVSRLGAIAPSCAIAARSDISAGSKINIIVANAGYAVVAATSGTTTAVGTFSTTFDIACKFAVMDLDLDEGGIVRDGVDTRPDGVTLGGTVKTANAANKVAPQLSLKAVVCAPLAAHPADSVVLAAAEAYCYLDQVTYRLLCARDAVSGACPRAGLTTTTAVLQEVTVDLPGHKARMDGLDLCLLRPAVSEKGDTFCVLSHYVLACDMLQQLNLLSSAVQALSDFLQTLLSKMSVCTRIVINSKDGSDA
jgi:hypothetical protein